MDLENPGRCFCQVLPWNVTHQEEEEGLFHFPHHFPRFVGPKGPLGTIPSAEVFLVAVSCACLLSLRVLSRKAALGERVDGCYLEAFAGPPTVKQPEDVSCLETAF